MGLGVFDGREWASWAWEGEAVDGVNAKGRRTCIVVYMLVVQQASLLLLDGVHSIVPCALY